MTRAGWILQREEGWLRRVALAPLAWTYAATATLHRALYRWDVLPRRRLASRVISVGSLVSGGAGKTPLAAWIANGLQRRGHRVVLASRGYGRTDRGAIRVVSDGRQVAPDLSRLGDEPVLLAAHAPRVPVLVGHDRGLAGYRALAAFGADVVVLDDGFHHHRLARDVDLVCFDGNFGLGNRAVLPRGPLREPTRALRCADAVAVLDGPLPAADAAELRAVAPGARWVQAARRPLSLLRLRDRERLPLEALRGRELGMLAATGLPQSFRRTLETLGARVVAERCFPDHHRYRPRDLAALERASPLWVTTEKDALKIVPWWTAGAEVWVLRITLELESADKILTWLEERLSAGSAQNTSALPSGPCRPSRAVGGIG